MNKSLIIVLILFSTTVFADRNDKSNPYSVFDLIPLNSPVKESVARFLIKILERLEVEEISYQVKNSGRPFQKIGEFRKINLVDGANGKELRIIVSKLPPGFYQLLVKIKDKSKKEHQFKTKFKDHAMFTVDSSLEVPMPDSKKNDATIGGVDSDNDGIRDDIQRWINEEYSSQPKVKAAVRQLAMGSQLDLLCVGNQEQSIAAGNKLLNDLTCLDAIVGMDVGAKISRELKSRLLNTKARLYAEIKANANFSGQAWRLPNTPEGKMALCSFDPNSF